MPRITAKDNNIRIKEAVLVPIMVRSPAKKPSLMLEVTTSTVTGPGVPKKRTIDKIYVTNKV
jgi:hypothetical protein